MENFQPAYMAVAYIAIMWLTTGGLCCLTTRLRTVFNNMKYVEGWMDVLTGLSITYLFFYYGAV